MTGSNQEQPKSIAEALKTYKALFNESAGGDVLARKANYVAVANNFYDLVTDFYRFGWGESFHFAPRKTRRKSQGFASQMRAWTERCSRSSSGDAGS